MIRIRQEISVDYDVAIAGAGPAGAATACHLARAGYRVALFDQRRFPRDKVCGDFVGPVALAELATLNLLSHPVLEASNKIRQAALYLDGKELIKHAVPHVPDLPDHGLCVPRMALDDVILNGAIAAGARVFENERVTGYEVERDFVTVMRQGASGEQRLRSRLLVGADGSSSQIARILRGGPPPRRDRILAVRAYFEGVDGPQDQADLYFSAATFPGYCWVFPTGGTSANVGVGALLETYPPTQLQLSQILNHIIDSDKAIRFRLGTARMCGKIVGWPLATFDPNLPITGDRLALVGDAAGLINPLNGEGIQYALQSARWVAETLSDSLQTDCLTKANLAAYATRVNDELRYDMALARMIIDLISNRTLSPLWLHALRLITQRAESDDEYAKVAGAILAGIAPARDALSYRMLWGTLQQAAVDTALTVAVDALHGPKRLWNTGTAVVQASASMAIGSALRPTDSLTWGVNCALSAFDLATQAAASVFGPRRAA